MGAVESRWGLGSRAAGTFLSCAWHRGCGAQFHGSIYSNARGARAEARAQGWLVGLQGGVQVGGRRWRRVDYCPEHAGAERVRRGLRPAAVKSLEVGRRVASVIAPGVDRGVLAGLIGLTGSQFAECLAGRRGFPPTGLAQLADVLRVDVEWLVSGQPNPWRLDTVAAVLKSVAPQSGEALNGVGVLVELMGRLWPQQCPVVAANADLVALGYVPLNPHGVHTVGELQQLLVTRAGDPYVRAVERDPARSRDDSVRGERLIAE